MICFILYEALDLFDAIQKQRPEHPPPVPAYDEGTPVA